MSVAAMTKRMSRSHLVFVIVPEVCAVQLGGGLALSSSSSSPLGAQVHLSSQLRQEKRRRTKRVGTVDPNSTNHL
jgi:hypothetical protein